MKKTIFALAVTMFMVSCGGSNETSVEATYDSVGVDSSVIIPALLDTLVSDHKDTVGESNQLLNVK
jgi:hypothetical protein